MAISIGGITPPLLLGVMWAAIGLAVVFTILKTTARLYVSRRIFVDDVLVYIALTILVIMGVLYTLINDIIFELVLVDDGVLEPTSDFAVQAAFFLKVQFAIIVLFWTTLWAVKFSFLMYYKKLFIGLPGHMQKFWWAVSIFALLAYLGCWATQLAACAPIPTYFTGQCNSPRDIYVGNLSLYYATSVDIICDIFIMALPLRLLWGLQINSKQKLALGGIFSLGIIIIIFAIVRVVEISATFNHVNPLWLALWSMIEASVAVVVSCLPSFRSFFSNRSSPYYYKERTPSSGSRLSRLSRSRRAAHRLNALPLIEVEIASRSQDSEDAYGINNGVKLAKGRSHTGYTAGAKGPDPFDQNERGSDESQEHILPKPPENSVLVRNDIYMTSEIV